MVELTRPDLAVSGRERLSFWERAIIRFVRGTFASTVPSSFHKKRGVAIVPVGLSQRCISSD